MALYFNGAEDLFGPDHRTKEIEVSLQPDLLTPKAQGDKDADGLDAVYSFSIARRFWEIRDWAFPGQTP
ncbi:MULTISPECIES: hypothetical protein [Rhizobium]|uniref:Uncharacterized protein n=1 Tax=Rhizobium paranaense TaxID=1650438 RepID=A0A7W9D4Z9_9HYPH|nr:hypothetical protein [Rhizobium paranaense]MBB5578012.1 hypothetical protein [Rhizobium paranaense]